MNCKPGDLAIVIKGWPQYDGLIGKIVKVININPRFSVECWNYEGRFFSYISDDKTVKIAAIPDKYLLPIKDIGDEDETLTWSAVPNKELVKL